MHNLNHLEPDKIILIGASTGGPGHIQKIIQALPDNLSAAVIIAQHMGDSYIPSFVNQLQKISSLKIQAAEDGMEINPGKIYICSFVTQVVAISSQQLEFRQSNPATSRYNPDIDQLFISASVLVSKQKILSIILTGVGDDGAKGCKMLSDKGAKCIAECETTAIVYGMPLQAKLMVKNIAIQSLQEIIKSIQLFGR